MAKPTIKREGVFTRKPSAAMPVQGIEEPKPVQTAIWLYPDELDWLDNQCTAIKRAGWRGVTRSGILRALIRSAQDKGVELAGASDEADLLKQLNRDADISQ